MKGDTISADLYRERAHLVAHLAALWPSVIHLDEGGDPDYRVVIISTTKGQMSWHIHVDDMDLFRHVPSYDASNRTKLLVWDGHTTEQKYERLRRLTEREARR